MRTFRWLVLISTIALVASCRSQQQSAAPEGPVPVGTVREVMHGIVESSADVLFNSVATTISVEGIQEKQPTTDEEWEAVQRSALTLAEAANLLIMPGRRVAKPEEENTSADPVELTPAQIQVNIEANKDMWLKHVRELQSVGIEAWKITNDRNVQGLLEIGERIDQVCESCHMTFWYPDDVRPQ